MEGKTAVKDKTHSTESDCTEASFELGDEEDETVESQGTELPEETTHPYGEASIFVQLTEIFNMSTRNPIVLTAIIMLYIV